MSKCEFLKWTLVILGISLILTEGVEILIFSDWSGIERGLFWLGACSLALGYVCHHESYCLKSALDRQIHLEGSKLAIYAYTCRQAAFFSAVGGILCIGSYFA